jgi:hypothetical protein
MLVLLINRIKAKIRLIYSTYTVLHINPQDKIYLIQAYYNHSTYRPTLYLRLKKYVTLKLYKSVVKF